MNWKEFPLLAKFFGKSESEEEFSLTRQDVEKIEASIESTNNSNAQLNSQVESLTSELSAAKEEVESLKAGASTHTTTIAEMQTQLDEANALATQLQAENSTLKAGKNPQGSFAKGDKGLTTGTDGVSSVGLSNLTNKIKNS